ncbi:nucleotide exchange factor SIL1 [Periplaneta americana]|uniref:nucleotide exchange factor SIL1 n=1 Tax=Periplaneta americana TaxID=6978 RepID=UPI0037E90BD1
MRTIFIVGILLLGVFNLKTNCETTQNESSEDKEHETPEEDTENTDIFKATHEWQTIKEGQAIPRGLHVRLNLQTGQREAKLMDDSEHTDVVSVPEEKEITPEEIKAALKNFKGEETVASLEDIERVKNNFRSYETLKKEFEALDLDVKTDLELMDELLHRFKSATDEQEILNILTDLEYLVHQFDNAREFARIGGLTDVVLPSLNATSAAIRAEAIRLLGSAVQSNSAVQIAALESGSIGSLLRVLALDRDSVVRSRTIYALSCLVRRFPTALIKLVGEGGLAVLASLFQSEAQDDLKLQVKVVTLLHDLVLEVKEAEEALKKAPTNVPQYPELQERHRQYGAVALTRLLVDEGWCTRLPRLLYATPSSTQRADRRDDLSSAVTKDLPVRPEHDVVEKVVAAMLALVDDCSERFQDAREVLIGLKSWYQELAAREELDKKSHNSTDGHYYYYTGLAQQVSTLASRLEQPKDEL